MECDCSKDIKQLEDRLKINIKSYSDLYNEFQKKIDLTNIHYEFIIKEYIEFENMKSKYDLIIYINSFLIIGLLYKAIFA